MVMNGSRVVYLIIISVCIILAASVVLVTLHGFGDSAFAQAQNNVTSSPLTPQQKAALCKPGDNFVNDTESSECGIPPTPTNNTTTTPPSSSSSAAANNTAGAEVPSKSLVSSLASGTTTAAVSNPTRSPLLSSQSTVAPQAMLAQGSQQQLATIANGTDGQNYTFSSTSPVVGSGKLTYLGFHGISSSTDNGSTGKSGSSVTKSDASHNSSSSSKHKDAITSPSSSTDHSSGSTKRDSNSNANNNVSSHIKSTTKSKPKKSHGTSDSVQGIIGSTLG
jgi:hypothetical protein